MLQYVPLNDEIEQPRGNQEEIIGRDVHTAKVTYRSASARW